MVNCAMTAADLEAAAATHQSEALDAKRTYDDLIGEITPLRSQLDELKACRAQLMEQCPTECAGAIAYLTDKISQLEQQVQTKQAAANAALTQFRTLSAQAQSEALGALKLRGGTAPTLTQLQPNTAVVGGSDLTMHAIGTGFSPLAVIVFNGGDERTDHVSATDVSTIVKPSTASGPGTVQVAVRNPDGQLSNSLSFTFTAPPTAAATSSK